MFERVSVAQVYMGETVIDWFEATYGRGGLTEETPSRLGRIAGLTEEV